MALLHVALLAGILVALVAVVAQLERLMTLMRAEITAQWTTLPHPVAGRPHCGHGFEIFAVHSSGNTRCQACAVDGETAAA